jgi:hypothetical protein
MEKCLSTYDAKSMAYDPQVTELRAETKDPKERVSAIETDFLQVPLCEILKSVGNNTATYRPSSSVKYNPLTYMGIPKPRPVGTAGRIAARVKVKIEVQTVNSQGLKARGHTIIK